MKQLHPAAKSDANTWPDGLHLCDLRNQRLSISNMHEHGTAIAGALNITSTVVLKHI